MGREIRMVPKGWEHPKDEKGNCIPMYDKDFRMAADEWMKDFRAWEDGTFSVSGRTLDEIKTIYGAEYYFEYKMPPDADENYWREPFASEPVCYQIYENVSEGTPVSPVFETEEEMYTWLRAQGYSEKASSNFIRDKWAVSMVLDRGTGQIWQGIETAALHKEKKDQ